MTIDRDKARAVLEALGKKPKSRRSSRRPARGLRQLLRGQFSLAMLLAVMTVSCLALTALHYRGDQIAHTFAALGDRAGIDAARFPESRSGELVPTAAGIFSLALGLIMALLVYRLRSDYGMCVVWALVCLAVLAVIIAWCWNVDSLAATKVKNLRLQEIVPAALFGLGCCMPVGAFLGWYSKFVTTS